MFRIPRFLRWVPAFFRKIRGVKNTTVMDPPPRPMATMKSTNVLPRKVASDVGVDATRMTSAKSRGTAFKRGTEMKQRQRIPLQTLIPVEVTRRCEDGSPKLVRAVSHQGRQFTCKVITLDDHSGLQEATLQRRSHPRGPIFKRLLAA